MKTDTKILRHRTNTAMESTNFLSGSSMVKVATETNNIKKIEYDTQPQGDEP